jgi:drug/metabolite transporter (DMT)-like permease
MRPQTRDNLIYLTVGFCVAALLAVDFFWADSHGRKMWLPSAFAFRAVAYTGVLGYFVARDPFR